MPSRLFAAAMLAVLALTAALYWPGLSGGYLFDDYPNFVDNGEVHVTTLDWRQWRGAALASPSAELRRPLAMLSLAANYYFTGLDPFPLKLTNLLIHMGNGLLLWRVVLATLRQWNRRTAVPEPTLQWAALGVAACWLLAPINLGTVLYVVQRMESLAQLAVLAGLWLYLAGRGRIQAGAQRSGLLLCGGGLVGGSALGLLFKESAVLLPLYAFLLEWALLRFAAPTPDGRRGLQGLYCVLLLVPLALALAWLLPRELNPAAYAGRPFTLAQRLLTESRILLLYMDWTLLPLPGALSFYHDDVQISTGLLSPPATLAALAALAALLAGAVVLRRRLPLFALGIAWFFAAHALTATIIPLELVFEHRNYFASLGLLIAAAGLMLAIPDDFGMLRRTLPAVAILAFAATTFLRAQEWGDPLRFAYAEAMSHPQSPRANYELGVTLAAASGYRPGSKLIDPAIQAMQQAAALPGSGASPWVGLIVVAGHMHRSAQLEWWSGLDRALTDAPPSEQSISALDSLRKCQHVGDCPAETQPLLSAYLAALSHPRPSGRLLASYGVFAANQLGDYALAERTLADAAQQLPGTPGIRVDLAKVLLLENQPERARAVLDQLDPARLDPLNAQRALALSKSLEEARPRPQGNPP